MTPQTYPLYATTSIGRVYLVVGWYDHGEACWPYVLPLGRPGKGQALYADASYSLTPPSSWAPPATDETAVLSTVQAR
jgi:hypothetical protein